MSKAQWNQHAWIRAAGPHSVRLNRRGGTCSEPATATEHVYDNVVERTEHCRQALDEVRRELSLMRDDDPRKRDLGRRMFVLQSELAALRQRRLEEYLPRYEEEFLRAARLLLPDDLIQRINSHVTAAIGVPPRQWNFFLAKRGYGFREEKGFDDERRRAIGGGSREGSDV